MNFRKAWLEVEQSNNHSIDLLIVVKEFPNLSLI